MSKWSTIKRIKRASEIARKRVNIRWNRLRAEQARLDAMEPVIERKISRRVIVIDDETIVREAVIYSTDTHRDAKRKLARVLALPAVPPWQASADAPASRAPADASRSIRADKA